MLLLLIHFFVFIFVVVLHLLLFFICCFSSFVFACRRRPSVNYRRIFTPILYFQSSPSQSHSRHFHFQPFRYLLAAGTMALGGHFLATGVFCLALLHRHFSQRLSAPPLGPAVLPSGLQGFILILETQARPIFLFYS